MPRDPQTTKHVQKCLKVSSHFLMAIGCCMLAPVLVVGLLHSEKDHDLAAVLVVFGLILIVIAHFIGADNAD